MNDQQFVAAVRREVLECNWETYKQILQQRQPGCATDQYWQEALRLYAGLDDAAQQTLLTIMRQVIVDTLSNMFAILDGVTRLSGETDTVVVELAGRKLGGSLQDLFLESEEHHRPE